MLKGSQKRVWRKEEKGVDVRWVMRWLAAV
jgi:hypothetical protein